MSIGCYCDFFESAISTGRDGEKTKTSLYKLDRGFPIKRCGKSFFLLLSHHKSPRNVHHTYC